ncbi:MAG: DUF4249 family protein [Bacteroidia bacterium]|nr:DUF4249 family protein [Bacteroidia bacterium]
MKISKIHLSLAAVAILAGLFSSCRQEFEVFAPEKELYAVYCILDPHDDAQYVKITHVFQYKGDAILYAQANDPSATGFNVTLTGGGKTWNAVQDDSVQRDSNGIWPQGQILYKFDTKGQNALQAGQKYSLLITRPSDTAFAISATTKIPRQPALKSYPGPFTIEEKDYSFPTVELNDEITLNFLRNEGFGFEIRAYLDYFDNGQPKTTRFGPTRVFTTSRGCQADNPNTPELCYVIPNQAILRKFARDVSLAEGLVSYVDTPSIASDSNLLARPARIEVTSLDSALTVFMGANNVFGFGLNLLLDKLDYSNISGGNVGIFGAINHTSHTIYISTCSKYLIGFIHPEFPPSDCNW